MQQSTLTGFIGFILFTTGLFFLGLVSWKILLGVFLVTWADRLETRQMINNK